MSNSDLANESRQDAQSDEVLGRDRYVVISHASALTQPLVFVAIGTAIFLCAWVFPPTLYSRLFNESNRVFLDLPTLAFVASCIVATILGISITGGSQLGRVQEAYRPLSSWERSRVTVVGALVGCILLNLLALYAIYRTGVLNAFVQALTTGSMRLIKQQRELLGDDENPIWITLLTPCSLMIPMIYHRARQFSKRDWRLWLFVFMVCVFVLAALLSAKRNIMVRPLFGCMCVYLMYPAVRGFRRFSVAKGLGFAGLLAVLVLVLFIGLAYVRNGATSARESTAEILRYLICPYNTAAALIDGELEFPGAGTGSYWTQFLWKMPGTGDRLSNLRQSWLGPPAPMGDQQRIEYLSEVGIRSGTAITAFGATFVDFGWFGPIAFFVAGVFAGLAWRSMRLGGIFGLCFYSAVAYSFVEWRANLLFPTPYFATHMAIGVLAWLGCILEKRGAQRV